MVSKEHNMMMKVAMQALAAILPPNTFIGLCVFIPEDEAFEYVSILRVNVEEPEEILKHMMGLIQNAQRAQPIDLRDVVGGMQ